MSASRHSLTCKATCCCLQKRGLRARNLLLILAFYLSQVKSNCEDLSKEPHQPDVNPTDRHAAELKV